MISERLPVWTSYILYILCIEKHSRHEVPSATLSMYTWLSSRAQKYSTNAATAAHHYHTNHLTNTCFLNVTFLRNKCRKLYLRVCSFGVLMMALLNTSTALLILQCVMYDAHCCTCMLSVLRTVVDLQHASIVPLLQYATFIQIAQQSLFLQETFLKKVLQEQV
jgi:hypothetical protein